MTRFLYFGKTRVDLFAFLFMIPLIMLNGAFCMAITAFCALCHEVAHVVAIYACGADVKRVSIGFLSAEITYDGTVSLKNDFIISTAGITANALTALAAFEIYLRFPDVRIAFLCLCSAVLAAVNILPVYGLDGFNMLYALTQTRCDANKAFSVCCFASGVSAAILAFLTFTTVIKTGVNTSVLLVVMIAAADLAGRTWQKRQKIL